MRTVAAAAEYRALMVFDTLPPGCIAHLVTDQYSMPHIRPGEFVVVDTNDRTPRHLDTYLIQWMGGSRSVCEAVSREFDWSDQSIPRRGWKVRSITGPKGRDAVETWLRQACQKEGMQTFPGWSEGPFRSDDGYLESKLVGCVIGLHAPSCEGPLRSIEGRRP